MLLPLALVLKAHEARAKDHRRTEMWLYLPKESRPPQALAQQMISNLMRETYLSFARWTAIISIVMWTVALIFSAIGLESGAAPTPADSPVAVA